MQHPDCSSGFQAALPARRRGVRCLPPLRVYRRHRKSDDCGEGAVLSSPGCARQPARRVAGRRRAVLRRLRAARGRMQGAAAVRRLEQRHLPGARQSESHQSVPTRNGATELNTWFKLLILRRR